MELTSYAQFVLAQRPRNPSLRNLCQFLTDSVDKIACRVTCLEISGADVSPFRHDLDIASLSSLLRVLTTESESQDTTASTNQPQGRILFVEDLTKEIIELLGSKLDIDPFFFASHIHSPNVDIRVPRPSSGILPSEAATQSFLSLQYHCALEFGEDAAALRKLSSDSNVPRKVMLLPEMRNARIGLAQQSCSVLVTSTKKGWLGLILVDASPTSTYRSAEKKMCLETAPFQGGAEDFLERPRFSDGAVSRPPRVSPLEDLVFYWSKKRPPSFNALNPSLLCMTYYPLKLVATEWVRYVEVLSFCMKHYEYSTGSKLEKEVLEKLNSDLHSLQSWARRCMQTLQKLQHVINFIAVHVESEENIDSYNMIIKDYKHLTAMVKVYSGRLETIVPFVTSLVQMVDSRGSLKEASNVRRLTNVALLFVPLSFVTGLFSMNDSVSARGLGHFFSVAVPLCAVVLITARLSEMSRRELLERLRRLRILQNSEV